MNKFKLLIKGIALLGIVGLLTSCGGGGGGSSSDNDDVVLSISGKVLGSLVSGAVVCIDENENGRCDSTDGFRIVSGPDGSYTIGEVPEALFSYPIVVEVPMSAMIVDPITGAQTPVATEYRLVYPPSEADNRFVSSLSTLVNSEFGSSDSLVAATQAVTERLNDAGINVSADALLDDYVSKATDAEASEEDINIYNVAKLASQIMQLSQENTASNDDLDAAALLILVAQKVFDNIDIIEASARNSQTLIDQATATAIVEEISEIADLDISEEDVESASALAQLPFDLGPVAYASVVNFKENSGAAWRQVSYIRFQTPGGSGGVSADDYRDDIPASYEIGIVDGLDTLRQTLGFHEPSWADTDPKFWYDFEEEHFTVYTRAETGPQWDADEYQFVLCPEGCASGDRIPLATDEMTAYENTLDIGGATNFATINSVVQQAQFITSDDEAFRDGDEQYIWLSLPAPPHGTYYRVSLGIDDDMDGEPESSRSRGLTGSFSRIFAPTDWIDAPHDFVARVSHRDAFGWANVNWEVSTGYEPTTLATEASFAVDDLFDVYRAEHHVGKALREGYNAEFKLYVADGNPLTALSFEDENGVTVFTACLPNDLPSSQEAVAVYSVDHENDGSESSFSGCENEDLLAAFGMTSTDPNPYFYIYGGTSRRGDEEVLYVGFALQQGDTNNTWGEPGEIFEDLQNLTVSFQDGSTITYPLDLTRPTHDFSVAGEPAVDVCSIGEDSLRVSWTPPGWMLAEYDAGELSVSLRLKPRDIDGNQLGSYTIRTYKGATSAIVSKALLQELVEEGEVIDHFRIEPYIGNMNYYGWDHRTYWTRVRDTLSADEVFNATACT